MFKHFLVAAVFLATVVNASLIGSPAVFHRRLLDDFQNTIQRRQSSGSSPNITVSDLPTECQSGCTPAVNAINTCSDAACLCTSTVDTSLQGCLNCILASPEASSVGTAGQQVVDAYNQACAGSGVSSITIATGASATASGNSTATATSSSAAAVTTSLSTTNVPTVTSTPTGTTAAVTTGTSAPAATTSKSGASATSAGVGLLTIVTTFLVAFMA